ncbi:MAG: HAMP domain-containing protein [Rubrobacter sp.]|nr:HAMP domain-containing protein [Rubrobacter sp.]
MRPRATKRSHRLPRGLGAKLFLSHFLVFLVAVLTLLIVVLAIAPIIFRRAFEPAPLLGGLDDTLTQAFEQTLLYSLLAAGVVATVAAALASLLISRRLVEPLRYVFAATSRIASGRYGERVPVREADELGELSQSFNAMARALEEAERRRMEVISDVSHELRTPLSTLQGYVEGLAEGVVEPSQETWKLLYAEFERLGRLVDDLRRLSRAEAGQLDLSMAPMSPAEAVRLAVGGMLPLFDEKGVELNSAVSEDLPSVLADVDRVVQVLSNLLSNALRHTPDGGRVVVKAEVSSDEVTFEVMDTGMGIAPEHLERVFERFYRVDKSRSRGEARGGSGVGLAISRALVEAMGGRIRVESSGLGEGATFVFTLPVSHPKS